MFTEAKEIVEKYYEDTMEWDKKSKMLEEASDRYKKIDGTYKFPENFVWKMNEAFSEWAHRLAVINDAGLYDDYLDYYMKHTN